MLEMITYPFMQRALLAGIIIGFIGSYYGVFIVQRKMSFLGSGLAHAAFGGVALGILLKTEPMWIAIPFTIIVSLAISILKEKTQLGGDTSIGILFSLSVALGVIFLSFNQSYSADAFSYLFGSVLTVYVSDLIIGLLLIVITILTFFGLWSRWAYSTFDSDLAKSDRINVVRDDYILSVLISIAIVISIKIVGIVLIAAYLVIPPATARLLSKTFIKMTILSVIIGVITSIIGLLISYQLDLPSGATIILTQSLVFIISIFISKLNR